MGWAVGYDTELRRHVGYGVPAYCDEPGCETKIDRGLAYACRDGIVGDDSGCRGFYCSEHGDTQEDDQECSHTGPIDTPEHPEWIRHVLTDESWRQWRVENPKLVKSYSDQLSNEQEGI